MYCQLRRQIKACYMQYCCLFSSLKTPLNDTSCRDACPGIAERLSVLQKCVMEDEMEGKST